MTTWPQVAMIVVMTLGAIPAFRSSYLHDSTRYTPAVNLGAALITMVLGRGILVVLLWQGGFWTPLGWPP